MSKLISNKIVKCNITNIINKKNLLKTKIILIHLNKLMIINLRLLKVTKTIKFYNIKILYNNHNK